MNKMAAHYRRVMATTADSYVVARSARIGEAYKSALAEAAASLSRRHGRAAASAADAGESCTRKPWRRPWLTWFSRAGGRAVGRQRPVRGVRSTPQRLRGPRVPPARSVVNPTTCSIRKPRGGGRSGPFKPFKPGALVLKLAATGDTAVRRPAISHYIASGDGV